MPKRRTAGFAPLARKQNTASAAALATIKSASAVKLRSSNTRTIPVRGRDGNRIESWRMVSEFVLESRDAQALSELITQLQDSGLGLARIDTTTSPQTRKKTEDQAIGEAIAAFKARAELAAQALGQHYQNPQDHDQHPVGRAPSSCLPGDDGELGRRGRSGRSRREPSDGLGQRNGRVAAVIALIQRVLSARVVVDGETVGEIDSGLLALIGVRPEDGARDVERLTERLLGYRVFSDEAGKMNRSLRDTGGWPAAGTAVHAGRGHPQRNPRELHRSRGAGSGPRTL